MEKRQKQKFRNKNLIVVQQTCSHSSEYISLSLGVALGCRASAIISEKLEFMAIINSSKFILFENIGLNGFGPGEYHLF